MSGKLLPQNNWNLEARQTSVDRNRLKIPLLLKTSEDDFLDLWLDILGLPDYIWSLLNYSEYIHLHFRVLAGLISSFKPQFVSSQTGVGVQVRSSWLQTIAAYKRLRRCSPTAGTPRKEKRELETHSAQKGCAESRGSRREALCSLCRQGALPPGTPAGGSCC